MKALILLLVVLSTLTGCATTLPGGMSKMSEDDFVNAKPEERSAYLNKRREVGEILTPFKDSDYELGEAVKYGDKKTGFTIQWNKKLSLVFVAHGHVSSPLGMESAAVMVFKADAKGNIHYQNQGGVEKPTTLLANVATQEGLGRLLLKGGFQVLSAASNGVLAAGINSCKSDGGCGNIAIVGGNSFAESNSNAQTQANTLLELGCSNCR